MISNTLSVRIRIRLLFGMGIHLLRIFEKGGRYPILIIVNQLKWLCRCARAVLINHNVGQTVSMEVYRIVRFVNMCIGMLLGFVFLG